MKFKNTLILINIIGLLDHNMVQCYPQITLEYQPNRPFYKPWPAGSPLEGQMIISPQGRSAVNVVNRFNEEIPQPPDRDQTISLEYRPISSSYYPVPSKSIRALLILSEFYFKSFYNLILIKFFLVYIEQTVPSGEPWPVNAQGYQNFSQTAQRPSGGQRPSSDQRPLNNQRPTNGQVPIIVDRFNEESTTHRNNQGSFGNNQQFGETIPAKPPVAPPSFHPVPGREIKNYYTP